MGFNFDKISIEKKADSLKGINISTKIDITNMEILESEIVKNEKLVKIQFNYEVLYNPSIAEVSIGGSILFAFDEEKAKEVVKSWKDKKMTEDFRISLFNFILRKSNVKALELEDQIGLPLHIPLPSVQKQKKKE